MLVCHGELLFRPSYIPYLECMFKASPCVSVPHLHLQGFQLATAQRRTQHNTATTTTTTHGDVSDSERERERENERQKERERQDEKRS